MLALIVSQETARQIVTGKRAMLRIARKGARRAPIHVGRAYVIQVRSGETPRCHITITSIEEAISGDIPCWIVRFKKGDHTDRPRLLKARPGHEGEIEGDYTDMPAQAMQSAAEEVSTSLQGKYAVQATEVRSGARKGLYDETGKRLLSLVGEARQQSADPRSNERWRGIERQCRSLLQAV